MPAFNGTEGYPFSPYQWPFTFFIATLLAHPFMLVSMRVQCAHFNKTDQLKQAYKNSFRAIRFIKSTQGIKGFYAGFGPGFLIYSAMSFEAIYKSIRYTKRMILKNQINN